MGLVGSVQLADISDRCHGNTIYVLRWDLDLLLVMWEQWCKIADCLTWRGSLHPSETPELCLAKPTQCRKQSLHSCYSLKSCSRVAQRCWGRFPAWHHARMCAGICILITFHEGSQYSCVWHSADDLLELCLHFVLASFAGVELTRQAGGDWLTIHAW